MKRPFSRFFYRLLLLLLPKSLRRSHGREMERLWVETLELAVRKRGWIGYPFVWFGCLADVLSLAASERVSTGVNDLSQNQARLRHVGRLATAVNDVRYAFRSLRKSRGFAVIAVLTLALGLGGSTAIFSVVDTVLLRPLPFPNADRLYTVWENNVERGRQQSGVAPPTFLDWRSRTEAFSDMAALTSGSATLKGGASPERVSTINATANVFSLLGSRLARGTGFPAEAEQTSGGHFVIVSFGFWQRWFGADPAAVGKTLDLDDIPHTVVGVLRKEFRFPEAVDLWVPLTFDPEELTEGMRGARYLQVIARLRAGVSVEQARSEMGRIAESLGETHAINAGWGVTLMGMHENMVSEFRRSLTLLLVATLMVLVIASVNAVNLVLVRISSRNRECAVRKALGATKWRMFQQNLAEYLVLSVMGGFVGAVVAFWAIGPLVALAPADIPRIEDATVDGRVVLFCLGVSVAVGVVLSLVSAISGFGSDPSQTLRTSQALSGHQRHHARQGLIVAEVGLSLVLLITAGLLLRSFGKLQRVDPGFAVSGVTAVSLSLPRSSYGLQTQQSLLYRQLLEQISARSEVASVGATTNLPLSGSAMTFGFAIDGRPDAALNEQLSAEYHAVTPGYFRTMGISLRSGRAPEWSDNQETAPVVIINETMERLYWPNDDPIGEFLTVVSQSGPVSREIIGVVADVRHAGLVVPPRAEVYVPLSQDSWSFATIVLDVGEGVGAGQLVQSELASIDPALPIGAVLPIERVVARWLAPLRFQTVLVGLFAGTALLLAALGIYGVVSYVVSLRTNEIGIRMALGARNSHVIGSVVVQGVGLAALGTVLGIVGAYGVTRHLSSLLVDVSPTDPRTFVLVPLLVLVVAALACLVPARNAISVDPVNALKEM